MKRRRHLFSDQNVFCFTADDLRQYLTKCIDPEQRVRIFEHLRECARCNLLYRDLSRLPTSGREIPEIRSAAPSGPPGTFQPRPQPPTPKSLAAGQIWTTLARPQDRQGREVLSVPLAGPVLISWPGSGRKDLDNLIRVIPTSLDTDFAVRGEDLVLREVSPLRYDILLTVWNESPMLAGNLDEYRGKVSDANLLAIQRIREGLLSGTKKRRRYDAELKRWRRLEMERTAYLSTPVNISLAEDEEAAAKHSGKQKRKQIPTPAEITDPGMFQSAGDLPWAAFRVTVELYSYQMAADTAGIGIHELHRTELPMRTDLISASLLQKRNELWLRLKTDEKTSVSVFVAGEKRKLVTLVKGFLRECRLGDVDALPEQLEVKIVHRREEHVFVIRPRRKE